MLMQLVFTYHNLFTIKVSAINIGGDTASRKQLTNSITDVYCRSSIRVPRPQQIGYSRSTVQLYSK